MDFAGYEVASFPFPGTGQVDPSAANGEYTDTTVTITESLEEALPEDALLTVLGVGPACPSSILLRLA